MKLQLVSVPFKIGLFEVQRIVSETMSIIPGDQTSVVTSVSIGILLDEGFFFAKFRIRQ